MCARMKCNIAVFVLHRHIAAHNLFVGFARTLSWAGAVGLQFFGTCGLYLVPDQRVLSLSEEKRADDERDTGNDNRVVQPGIDVTCSGDDRKADQWQESAEDAVADVIWQRQGRVPDLRRERLDQISRDGAVNHRHPDNLNEYEQDQFPRG